MHRMILAALACACAFPAHADEESITTVLAKYNTPIRFASLGTTEVAMPPSIGVTRIAARDLVVAEARRQGVPVPLALAITHQESGFNSRAKSYQNAYGLMQVIAPTARLLGYTGPVQGLFDPAISARLGVAYLKQGLNEGGVDWAITRYHGGPDTRLHGPKTRRYLASVKRLVVAYSGGRIQ